MPGGHSEAGRQAFPLAWTPGPLRYSDAPNRGGESQRPFSIKGTGSNLRQRRD